MFNLQEARSLFYKEKSLDDFDLESENSIFRFFYELLLEMNATRIEDLDMEEIITDMFNDACYICTIALLIKRPALKLGVFRQFCIADGARNYSFSTDDTRANEVLCMASFLMQNYDTSNTEIQQFISLIDRHLSNHSANSRKCYEKFFGACFLPQEKLPSGFFNQRILDYDEFDWVGREPDWKYITNNYNIKDIKEIVGCWKNPEQRDIVIDDIVLEVDSDYYFEPLDGQPYIKFSGKGQEEMIDYVESLRLTDRSLKDSIEKLKRENNEKYVKKNPLNDPKIYSYNIPFLIYDENNETIISRTVKEINEGRQNPFMVNWMEVTLFDSYFVKDLLENIHSEFLMDVAQAIDYEEARHIREDGQYTNIASIYYGTGQGCDNFYSYMQDNKNEEDEHISAISIAEGILKRRQNAEKFQKKLEQHQRQENNEAYLSTSRQEIMNQMLEFVDKGDWVSDHVSEKVKEMLRTVLGQGETQLKEPEITMSKTLWQLLENGRCGENGRVKIVWQNLVGYFDDHHLLKKKSAPLLNVDFFGNKDGYNNINKGRSDNMSNGFKEIQPLLDTYLPIA